MQTFLLRIIAILVVICAAVTCRDDLNSIPKYKANIIPKKLPSASWESKCFKNANATILSIDSVGMLVQFYTTGHTSPFCRDLYLFATLENYHVREFVFRGSHKQFFYWADDIEYQQVLQNGLFIFTIEDGVIGTLRDIWHFSRMFMGKHQIKNNVEFMRKYMNVTLPKRHASDPNIQESEIESGDQFAILNYNKGETLIMYGTGGWTDHTAMALRINGTLFVVESAGSPDTHGKEGIIRTPFAKWLADVKRTHQNILLLKLNAKQRARYNETAAVEFFLRVEGMPYGFRNFIYGWIDTANNNFPPPITYETFLVGTAIYEKLQPENAQRFILSALNMRLGTQQLNFTEILELLQTRNMTLGDLISMPEQDSWLYSDGYAMVCNVFVMRMYKEAGLLSEFIFQAAETTPRDSYELDLYDKTGEFKPKSCYVQGDTRPYCQLTGDYLLTLPHFSTIQPFDHMFEKCGSLPPAYERVPAKC